MRWNKMAPECTKVTKRQAEKSRELYASVMTYIRQWLQNHLKIFLFEVLFNIHLQHDSNT